MMGVRLMRNFDRPYLSKSYTEFFPPVAHQPEPVVHQLCVHPLGANRKGKARKYLNTILVFALCGLWHGANWTYVLWGLYAAFWLCVESALDIRHRFGPKWACPPGGWCAGALRSDFYSGGHFVPGHGRGPGGEHASRNVYPNDLHRPGVNSAFALMDMDAVGFLRVTFSIVCMAKIYRLTGMI